jgi:hypothetical protein
VSTTAEVLLGLIALATVAMAAVQIGLVIVAVRLARQLQDVRASIDREIRPLLLNLSAASNNVVRVTELAVSQIQHVDRLFGDLAHRVDDATRLVQSTLLAPLREGRALLAAVGATLGALRDMRPVREESLPTDDDPLFIG